MCGSDFESWGFEPEKTKPVPGWDGWNREEGAGRNRRF